MRADDSGLTDEVIAELNPTGPEPDYGPQRDPIPARPADDDGEQDWVEYVVALGADRTFVTETTIHRVDALDAVESPAFERAELIELADRLGG